GGRGGGPGEAALGLGMRGLGGHGGRTGVVQVLPAEPAVAGQRGAALFEAREVAVRVSTEAQILGAPPIMVGRLSLRGRRDAGDRDPGEQRGKGDTHWSPREVTDRSLGTARTAGCIHLFPAAITADPTIGIRVR